MVTNAESLQLIAPRKLKWFAKSLPVLGPQDLLVQTVATAVSVGTELALFRGDARLTDPIQYPRKFGYESLARVTEIGSEVTGFFVGQRIVSTFGNSTWAVLDGRSLRIPIPDDIPDEVALLSVLWCEASKGVRKLHLESSLPVLISGAGTMGLLALYRCLQLGVQCVDVLEPDSKRRALALRIGAHQVHDSGNYNPCPAYRFGIECSSRDAAFAMLQRSLRPNSELCVLSDGNIEPLTLNPVFHSHELRIIGSSDGEDYVGDARELFDTWRLNHAPLQSFFEWRVGSKELEVAFARMLQEVPPIKALVTYDAKPNRVG